MFSARLDRTVYPNENCQETWGCSRQTRKQNTTHRIFGIEGIVCTLYNSYFKSMFHLSPCCSAAMLPTQLSAYSKIRRKAIQSQLRRPQSKFHRAALDPRNTIPLRLKARCVRLSLSSSSKLLATDLHRGSSVSTGLSHVCTVDAGLQDMWAAK